MKSFKYIFLGYDFKILSRIMMITKTSQVPGFT